MPIYEYKCETCGKVFEYQQKITDEPLETCPEHICQNVEEKGRGKVHRLISKGVGLVFRGNGFYITDYSRKPNNTASMKLEHSTPKNGTSPIQNEKSS